LIADDLKRVLVRQHAGAVVFKTPAHAGKQHEQRADGKAEAAPILNDRITLESVTREMPAHRRFEIFSPNTQRAITEVRRFQSY
jgi:hypothetical protein